LKMQCNLVPHLSYCRPLAVMLRNPNNWQY